MNRERIEHLLSLMTHVADGCDAVLAEIRVMGAHDEKFAADISLFAAAAWGFTYALKSGRSVVLRLLREMGGA
jgi:hypothetical protein